jgi:hypothetical protein
VVVESDNGWNCNLYFTKAKVTSTQLMVKDITKFEIGLVSVYFRDMRGHHTGLNVGLYEREHLVAALPIKRP